MRNAAQFPCRFIVAPMLFLVLLLTGAARAMDNPRVDDKAGFFSPDAMTKANTMIAQIKRDHGKDLYIETHPSIPSELRSQFQPAQREQFFDRWAKERARDAKVDGVLVLITREPSYLKVAAGADTQRQAFLPANLSQLRQIMTDRFKAKQFDEGLLEGVAYVRTTLAQSMPKRGESSSATPAPAGRDTSQGVPAPSGKSQSPLGGMTSWICIGFAALMVFLLFRAMRSRSAQYMPGHGRYGSPGDPNAPHGQPQHPGAYPQAPGSGMGRGFLGGLLGGALGGYAYDRFMRRPGEHGTSDPGNAASGGAAGIEPPPSSDIGSDFTGPGGDFGDSGGGGDFGGGGDGGGSGGDF